MLKLRKVVVGLLLMALLVPSAAFAQMPEAKTQMKDDRYEREDCTKISSLTKDQQKKLEKRYEDLLSAKKALLDTYVEIGALTSEQANHRWEAWHNHVERVKKRHYKWCTEIENGKMEHEYDDDHEHEHEDHD